METFNHVVLWLRLHSILWMMAVFVLIVVSAYWPGRRGAMERYGMIPLRDDE
jgi:cbb3-type cytochrome oxidase subunit 3